MMLFRKILFYCFLLIYFTLCPFLIFYTLGYRFDLHGDRGIVKTGALSITTLPEGAAVSLGNRRPSHKTPAVILNLRVGPYGVRIEKEGYQPWSNQVSIEAEKAVVAEKIILLPLELKPELIAPGPLKKIAIFKEGTLAVILRGSQLSELMVLDLVKNTEYVLSEGSLSQFQSSKVGAVYTMPASSVFWIWLEDSGGRMLRIRVRLGVLEAEDWSRYFSGKPDELQWDPGVENKLYAFRDKALSVINLDRGVSYAAGRDLQGFKVSKQRIFMSRSQGVVRMDSDALHPRDLLDDPVLAEELFQGRDKLDIGVYSGGTLLFLDPREGALFSNHLPYWIARKNVRGYAYDELSHQAAVWTQKKIGVLDFSKDGFLREEAFEHKIRKRWIYRGGNAIQQLQWAAEGTQLIFLDGNKVYLMETAQGLEARPRFLMEADPEFPLFFSEMQGLLYYGDPETHHWMALRLIPKREILGEAFAKTGRGDERVNSEQLARTS